MSLSVLSFSVKEKISQEHAGDMVNWYSTRGGIVGRKVLV